MKAWILTKQGWGSSHHNLRFKEVAKRMVPAVDHILGQPEQTVLICMHGRAIRILLCVLLNYPLRSMDIFEHENVCLYVLNYAGGIFTIERYNDTVHLQELKKTIIPVS